MERRDFVISVDEKDCTLIAQNKRKVAEFVKFALFILDMDEDDLSLVSDASFQKVVKHIKEDFELEDFWKPRVRKLRLIKAGLKKEGR